MCVAQLVRLSRYLPDETHQVVLYQMLRGMHYMHSGAFPPPLAGPLGDGAADRDRLNIKWRRGALDEEGGMSGRSGRVEI